MKILVYLVSYEIKENFKFERMMDKIVKPLRNDGIEVEIASCVTAKNGIEDKVDYSLYSDGMQLTKSCYLVSSLAKNNYDWYIKIRPDLNIRTIINKEFIEGLSKEKINARCRYYSGPPIYKRYGFSCRRDVIWQKKSEIEHIIPDDQMYVFHKNCLKAFEELNLEKYSEYCEKLCENKEDWMVEEVWLNKDYWLKPKKKWEPEGHHAFIWYSRGIFVNIIDFNCNLDRGGLDSDVLKVE
tara:strand:- start:18288 stop:19007 length:720 start_codon:yes stop_codon:yes gene_type:complete